MSSEKSSVPQLRETIRRKESRWSIVAEKKLSQTNEENKDQETSLDCATEQNPLDRRTSSQKLLDDIKQSNLLNIQQLSNH